jgi:hypothetical protein
VKDTRPVVVIACKVFQDLLERHLPPDLVDQVSLMDYGLHEYPNTLRESVQETIDRVQEPSLILIVYGLCGNGLSGIHSRSHVLVIPRADDCIAILLGSYRAYREEFNKNPGTYYLSKGWLESGSDPLSEYQDYLSRYGRKKADFIMDQQYTNYGRLVLVAHSREDLEMYRPRAQEVARYCERWGMQYEELLGSDHYFRGLIKAIESLPDASDEAFLVIQPGGIIDQSQFLRIDF